jgi:ABC-2 type transport system permease protein
MKTMYARAWVRVMSAVGEPVWLVVNLGFPLFSSFGMALLYRSAGATSLLGFAILGGIMISFWGSVLWSMAAAFYWDKQIGLFEVYLSSPAPISALLIGMTLGGVVNTAPSAVIVGALGWFFFNPAINPSWAALILTFALTLASLYSMGMVLSALYLAYGREAETINEAIHEPISVLSGVYFPSIGSASPFPFFAQAIALIIPLTIGMDALRRTLFFYQGIDAIYPHLIALSVMALVLLLLSEKAMIALENRGRREGTLTVRLR